MVTSGRFEEEYAAMAASPRRIRLRDVKPYACPDSLSDLQGPYSGVIRLPHTVRWVGEGMADLDTFGGVRVAYQALLAEGNVADQVMGLNARKLVEMWPFLNLDPRVRRLWESRFPLLKEHADA